MAKKKKRNDDTPEETTDSLSEDHKDTQNNPYDPSGNEEESSEQPIEDNVAFPIVGIGASAGGLEAFETLFKHMPPDSGMAFILVQHLDPTHESILVDLVKRCTEMSVFQVEDGVRIQPDCIYVIPPNRDMALMRGTLHLMEPIARRGFRLPIDFLFRSIAEDLAEKAICIVLSGTGSDGTLGLKEIRGVGGMTMVQDPETARYDGMPRNAIATGLVDYILPSEKMPEQLIDYADRLFVPGVKRPTPSSPTEADTLEKIFILLRSHTKHDFSLYKKNTIHRRIERRMVVNQIEHVTDYVRYLRKTPLEVETLFRELLIGVTSFFRDTEAFDVLEQEAIPRLIENRQIDQPIRVWIPGCSTGEEAYSIAMLIREQMNTHEREFEVQIFATDIDDQAIETARSGLYPDNIAADVSLERLQRFFTREGNTYQVTQQIREMVVFATQSITKDPPFSKMDLISCRNLLIYLGPQLQKKVIPLFHYALKLNGFLFLGTSETLGEYDRFFHTVDRKAKLFQRITGEQVPQGKLDFTAPPLTSHDTYLPPTRVSKGLNVRELTERVLLQEYTPPCVIINDQSDILFFHGKTVDYLEPASGEASFNIMRMAREGLQVPLSTALRKAFAQKQEIIHENIHMVGDNDRILNLIITPVVRPSSMQGLFMVVFEDISPPNLAEQTEMIADVTDERDRRLIEVERELQSAREYLQTTIEELETTNEELKSTNEELQSSNEELQSTNEELETAKEELQSVNEELITVNSELQSKIDELTHANNDLNNLLANVEVGIIFLDLHLHIQRFNPAAAELVNIIMSDVGRPISHIVSNLAYDNLVHDAREVLDTLIPHEGVVQTNNGYWYGMRIRPYRTVDNMIDGLVITFANITEQKRIESEVIQHREHFEELAIERTAELQNESDKRIQSEGALLENKTRLQQALDKAEIVVFRQDHALRYIEIHNINSRLEGENVIGKTDAELLTAEDAIHLVQLKQRVMQSGIATREDVRTIIDGEIFHYDLTIEPAYDNVSGEINGVICISMNITSRKQLEASLLESQILLSQAQVIAHLGSWDWNLVSNEIQWSDNLFQLLGLDSKSTGDITYDLALKHTHPDDRESVDKAIQEAIDKHEHWEIENRIIREDGIIRTVISRGKAIYNEDGQAVRMIGAMQDITK